jgi:hypothetical protein
MLQEMGPASPVAPPVPFELLEGVSPPVEPALDDECAVPAPPVFDEVELLHDTNTDAPSETPNATMSTRRQVTARPYHTTPRPLRAVTVSALTRHAPADSRSLRVVEVKSSI